MFRREDATGETLPRRKDSAARRSELHLLLAAWDEQSCALVARLRPFIVFFYSFVAHCWRPCRHPSHRSHNECHPYPRRYASAQNCCKG